MTKATTPLLKWPGGKRWLVGRLAPVLKAEIEGMYFEPFLGAGAMFLALQPLRATLSDCNPELIQFFTTLKKAPEAVTRAVWQFTNTSDCYYRVRASIPRTEVGKAARFLYLNRTCWGGVYRLNRRGEFNVPFGDSGRVICRRVHVLEMARALTNAKLKCCDFGQVFKIAGVGDVLYCDPPYTTKGAGNGFVRYNESLFSWHDQQRLAHAAQSASEKGAFVAVSGLDHFEILNLYHGWWKCSLARPSLIGRDVSSRKNIREVILLSRQPKITKDLADLKLEIIR